MYNVWFGDPTLQDLYKKSCGKSKSKPVTDPSQPTRLSWIHFFHFYTYTRWWFSKGLFINFRGLLEIYGIIHQLGGGFKYFWNFHPYLGKWFPIWRAYFSKGLKPPTSYTLDFFPTEVILLTKAICLAVRSVSYDANHWWVLCWSSVTLVDCNKRYFT